MLRYIGFGDGGKKQIPCGRRRAPARAQRVHARDLSSTIPSRLRISPAPPGTRYELFMKKTSSSSSSIPRALASRPIFFRRSVASPRAFFRTCPRSIISTHRLANNCSIWLCLPIGSKSPFPRFSLGLSANLFS